MHVGLRKQIQPPGQRPGTHVRKREGKRLENTPWRFVNSLRTNLLVLYLRVVLGA